jgi:hypothetical protein
MRPHVILLFMCCIMYFGHKMGEISHILFLSLNLLTSALLKKEESGRSERQGGWHNHCNPSERSWMPPQAGSSLKLQITLMRNVRRAGARPLRSLDQGCRPCGRIRPYRPHPL